MSITTTFAAAKSALRLVPWGIAAAALLFGTIQLMNARHSQKLATAEARAHTRTKADYRSAQALAKAEALAAVDRERARIDLLTMKVIQTHENRNTANLGSIASLLRNQTARRPDGQADLPGGAGVPAGPLQPAAEALVSASDLYAIGSAYAQCDSLIEWADGIGDRK